MTALNFSRTLSDILSSELGMFIGGFLITAGVFVLVPKFFNGGTTFFHSVHPTLIICSLTNAISTIIVGLLFPSFLTVLPLVLVPIFLTIEMKIFLKDSNPGTPIFIGFCAAIHFVVYYDFSSAILQIWYNLDSQAFGLASMQHRNMQFVIACVLCFLTFVFLHKTSLFPNEEFNKIVHDKAAGSMLSALVMPASIVLIITHILLAPVSSSSVVTKSLSLMLYANSSVKSLFILMSCYIVILVQSTLEKRKGELRTLEDKLEEESAFRETIHRNTIYYYQVNTRTNAIIDNNHFLNESVYKEGDTHLDFIDKILPICVHENYWDMIGELSTLNFINEQAGPAMINERIQMSPKGLLHILNLESGRDTLRKNLEFYKKDYIWVEISTTTACDRESGDTILYITISDIDDKVDVEMKLIQAANTDNLTGLFNRKAASEMISARVQKKETGALFMVDLDFFKDVNDMMGHPRGDKVLVDTASRLRGVFREDDIICRMGGDEFAVFAGGFHTLDSVRQRAELLNSTLREDIFVPASGHIIHVSASIGVARFPEDAQDIEQLYELADNALYKSKEAGRNRYTLYSSLK